MFKRHEVNKFVGLDSNTSPDLLPNEVGTARDIMNFRMEKIGKLVTRDGYMISTFADYAESVDTSNLPANTSHAHYIHNGGIVGIGEFVLTEKWHDTEKFMVYYIRTERLTESMYADLVDADKRMIPNIDNCYKKDNRTALMSFLFVPMSGKSKGLVISSSTLFGGRYAEIFCDHEPQGDYENAKLLYAPTRDLSETSLNFPSIGNLCFEAD